ncbi:MAG: PSD1 and planctomycete cytochrome C domain-containing protein [Bryobacteraceae bacterium]
MRVKPWNAALACLAGTIIGIAAQAPPAKVDFDQEVRPILSNNCFRCHGPDESSRVGGFRLDRPEEALRQQMQGTPIVPGDPDRSELVQRIFSKDSGSVMPPVYANHALTAEQKDTLRRWIAQGAKYELHWSYRPILRPAVPEIHGPTIANPIDAFIQARLAREGLKPSPEADRRTLIRRVSLDLTGLLPSPEEVAAFETDRSPNAYEKVVDRLLASPEYAEQQAVHWLDAVRYADSTGFHSDGARPVWPYRDYVLRAFRDDKPFDVFTREQLAGDLIPNAAVEQKVAATYNRLNRTSAEGGVQPKEYVAKYGADRVRDLSVAWLGTSMGCAECHDHKFDPILTKDFYAMKAFFADVKEDGLVSDTIGPNAFKPTMPVYEPGQKEAIDALDARIAAAKADLDHQAEALVEQQRQWEKDQLALYQAGELAWKFPIPVDVSARSATLTVQKQEVVQDPETAAASPSLGPGMISVTGANPDNETYSVTLQPGAGKWASIGIETGQDDSLPGANIARGSERFIVTEVDAELRDPVRKTSTKLPFLLAASDAPPVAGLSAMAAIDGDSKTGWGLVGGPRAAGSMLMLRFSQPVTASAASRIVIHIHQDSDYRKATMGRFRIGLASSEYAWPGNGRARGGRGGRAPESETAGAAPAKAPDESSGKTAGAAGAAPNGRGPAAAEGRPFRPAGPGAAPQYDGMPGDLARALALPPEKRSDDQKKVALDYFEYSNPQLRPARIELAKLEAKSVLLASEAPVVMLTESVEPREVRILPRGNWMDDSGAIVQPAIPEFLGKLDTSGRRATRMDLANWLVSDTNPLTARAFANRMWREFFGIGISKNLEDLGSQGEAPVHPELLDWLASEFMKPEYQAAGAHQWDVKHLLRVIVTSYTYRQSSLSTPELDKRDPEDRLLARQSPLRIDAESVHDTVLEISGLLVRQFGGESVRPYQPEGFLAALNFPKRDWSASRGSGLYRRSVYTHWQRTFLHPSLANFDAPTREECAVNRMNSNTPLQALDLLNDPIFVEAARVFAENILDQGGKTLDGQLEWAFERSLERKPDESELKALRDIHHSAAIHFQTDRAGAAGLLAIGDSPVPKNVRPADLAAMTTVARVILNLHEAITRD